MGSFLIAVIAIVAGILGSALAKILADEFKAWRPNMVHRLIGIAASLLSGDDRERYQEEWSAYVEEVPGDLGKLIAAGGFVFAALRMTDRRFVALGTKRMMDISMAASALVLLSPPLLIAALAVKIENPGPAFYAQRRIGKDGKEFRCLKFRTMRTDSADRLSELLRTNPSARHEWETTGKLRNDPRLTIVGKFMRQLSIDELPQLINILRGEMSVVGPRAMPTDYPTDEETQKLLKLRQMMRPGLTGLWQVSYTEGDRHERGRILSDVLYVLEHSIALDIGILVKTAMSLFKDGGEGHFVAGILAIAVMCLPGAIILAVLAAVI